MLKRTRVGPVSQVQSHLRGAGLLLSQRLKQEQQRAGMPTGCPRHMSPPLTAAQGSDRNERRDLVGIWVHALPPPPQHLCAAHPPGAPRAGPGPTGASGLPGGVAGTRRGQSPQTFPLKDPEPRRDPQLNTECGRFPMVLLDDGVRGTRPWEPHFELRPFPGW